MTGIERVGVIGCGLMGSGIAEVSARAGYQVLVREVDDAAMLAGRERINTSLGRAVEREKITASERERALERLSFTTEIAELGERDLVIEAVVEDPSIKISLFRELDGICPAHTILASNTSSLPITEMAAATGRPDRMIGLHFFNPVPVMRLVEIVRTIATSDDTLESVRSFAETLGKEVVNAPDSAGFLVNRLLVPFMLDAVRLLEAGVGSIEDLDKSMVLGCGHPMGPLTLCDFVGIDTVLRIAEIMHGEYRTERYAPPPLLRRLVSLGRFGRKTSLGFYDYSQTPPVAMPL